MTIFYYVVYSFSWYLKVSFLFLIVKIKPAIIFWNITALSAPKGRKYSFANTALKQVDVPVLNVFDIHDMSRESRARASAKAIINALYSFGQKAIHHKVTDSTKVTDRANLMFFPWISSNGSWRFHIKLILLVRSKTLTTFQEGCRKKNSKKNPTVLRWS